MQRSWLDAQRTRIMIAGNTSVAHVKMLRVSKSLNYGRLDKLRLEMQAWWGGSTTGTSRVNRLGLCEHLTRNAIIGENSVSELLQQQWFICGTKVCRNFYLRARGIVLSAVKKYSKEIFSTKGNSQTGLGINTTKTNHVLVILQTEHEIVTWMKLFAHG